MGDPPIIDAEFEVIEPGTRMELCAPGEPHPLTVTICYWVAAIICIGLAAWARPHLMHVVGQVLFHDR